MDTIAIVEILVLAAVAGVILYRLWTVLGTRTGSERSPERPASEPPRRPGAPAAPAPANDKGVIPFPARPSFNVPAAAQKGVADIAAVDRNFEPESFVQGALQAHERIVECFAAGDREELRMLLGSEVYKAFDAAIADRESKGLTASTVFVKQSTPQIVWAALKGRSAEVGVRYESELIQFSKDAQGEIVEGSDTYVKKVIDRWTWVRDVKSSDPNWKLEDTNPDD
jgi:predicted lipid-binding transport protein (Tim44 family)